MSRSRKTAAEIDARYARRRPRPPAPPTDRGLCPSCGDPVIVRDRVDPGRAVRIDLPTGTSWWHADCRADHVRRLLDGGE